MIDEIKKLEEEIGDCSMCGLQRVRNRVVPGVLKLDSEIMFIGEAPGAREDAIGRPFVGSAGQLLTKMVKAMGLSRDDVSVVNTIKCRPPDNRDPKEHEIEMCFDYLSRQIDIVKPKLLVTLGNPATKTILKTDIGITRLRGKFYKSHCEIPVMPTYHPAYLLRNPSKKGESWEDLKKIIKFLKHGLGEEKIIDVPKRR
jgi:DNA polymerase